MIDRRDFGKTRDGVSTSLYTLTNKNGASIQLTNYGAILVSVNVPDSAGKLANVNAGFPALEEYLKGHPMFGSTVGRFANRIGAGKFSIGSDVYKLAINNGPNHLHGGKVGFDKKVWKAEEIEGKGTAGVKFEVFSPDGDEGYPGNLHAYVTYSWDDENKLTMRFEATTDRETPVNLTNHAYFNLGGIGSGSIRQHVLQIHAHNSLEVDDTLIPTGKIIPVANTPLDFTTPKAIGQDIDKLKSTSGYDHCYVVDGTPGTLRPTATVVDPISKRAMEMQTTQPGVQLYTGNHLGGDERSAGLKSHEAFCLEAQHYPDSPNKPEFPSTFLMPGGNYLESSTYRFFVSA